MEKKLTDEEIVKALSVCATDKIAEVRCPECILEEENGCCTVLLLNALDLIHRLQEENKDLKEERENMHDEIFGLEEEKRQVQEQVDEYFTKAFFYYQKCKAYGIEFFYDDEFEAKPAKEGKTIVFPKLKGDDEVE